MGIFEAMLHNILAAFYHHIIAASVFAILAVGIMNYMNRIGFREVLREWWQGIKTSSLVRARLLFFMYAYFLFDFTLMSRRFMYTYPLDKLMEGWWIEYDNQGRVSYEAFENLIFFIPYIILLLCSFPKIAEGKSRIKRFGTVFLISFLTSFAIETLQAITKVGTVQVSDLVYNTVGGLIGYLIYSIASLIRRKTKKKGE